MDYWVAFSLGLMGSLHCAGMCGPIVLALPLTVKEKSLVVYQSLIYNLGRIITYALMGLFMGLMGWGVTMAGYQKGFSIVLGIALILSAIFSFSLESHMVKNRYLSRFFNWVKQKLSKSLSISNRSSAFKIGMLNGLLPCGLVYIALAGAISSGTFVSGAIYMFAFGLGTIPLMAAIMVFGKLNKSKFLKFRRLIPIGLLLFGVYLIYRGINLQIPPDLKFWESNNFPIMCH